MNKETSNCVIENSTVVIETVSKIPQTNEYTSMKKIEYINLSPTASPQDVHNLCQDAITYGFHSICMHPTYVNCAYKFLKKNQNLLKVQIASVVGYPLGENTLKSKIYEIKNLFSSGADIVDVYLTTSAIKYNNRKDKAIKKQVKKFAHFTKIMKDKQRAKKKDRIVRIVLDTRYLSYNEMQTICNYCIDYKIKYVTLTEGVTSTKLNFEEIQNLVKFLAGRLQVKLNYNIRTMAELKALPHIDLIATKFGQEVVEELQQELDANAL